MIQQVQAVTNSPRFADTAAIVSGGAVLTSHWFLVADELARFGANVVAIVTGAIAIAHYAPMVWGAIKRAYSRFIVRTLLKL